MISNALHITVCGEVSPSTEYEFKASSNLRIISFSICSDKSYISL